MQLSTSVEQNLLAIAVEAAMHGQLSTCDVFVVPEGHHSLSTGSLVAKEDVEPIKRVV